MLLSKLSLSAQLKITRVTIMAENTEAMTPTVRVTAKPFTGPLAFQGHVRREAAAEGGMKELGVQFEWKDPGDADPLNRCLYGNTLQWDVNSWAEVRKFNFLKLLPNYLR